MKPTVKVEVVSGVVIEKDGKYLLVQEKQPKAYGLWNLPAGKVDVGETIENAAIREAKEECGFDVLLSGPHLIVVHESESLPVLHAFKAVITGGELRFPEDEILDAKWFTYEEILAMKEKLRIQEYIIGAIDEARKT